MNHSKPILKVDHLTKYYGTPCPNYLAKGCTHPNSNTCAECGCLFAANAVSFSLMPGEILGVIGESGSGKSTLLKMLVMDSLASSGTIELNLDGKTIDVNQLNAAQKRALRNHKFGIVYQNPHLGLNFKVSAGGNIAERVLMKGQRDYGYIRQRASLLLERAEVSSARMDELPGNFSGGMQQRVQIAKALATEPDILFLDEITTGLDLSVQAKILDLILELQQTLSISMIVVTHDLGVVRTLADRTLVMQHGRVIESGLTDQVLEDPQHAYTQQLVASSL
jgi:putative phosphonate transport system ATP-binding protein